MGFKFKHIFKGPTKVLNAVGQSGVFGVRHGKFRVAGIPIGRDLAPVVQAVAVVATIAVGGPALASATGLGATTATVITSASASGAMTGLSGGDASQVTRATACGAGMATVGGLASSAPTLTQAVTTQVVGATAVGLATGSEF